MQDGHTRKVKREPAPRPRSAFLSSYRAVIVTLSGTTAGNEYELDRERTTVGRGPGVDLAFDDRTMSKEHAAFEVRDGALWVRDLASTNGVLVNGGATLSCELKHGDRIDLGEHRFQLVLEERKRGPQAYALDEA
jgi:pSer/pThr/pTyr-binding forkhead associated (FHA) protein